MNLRNFAYTIAALSVVSLVASAKSPGGGSTCPAITPINPPITSPTTASCANSGCTDASFGTNGFVLTNTDGSVPYTIDGDGAVSVQQIVMPDASTRSLAIGTTTSPIAGVGNGIALVRYNVDGSLDTAFGNGGIVTLFPSLGSSIAQDGLLDAQGNIVVAAIVPGGAQVFRFHPDGTLDTSFNGTGSSQLISVLFPEALTLDQAGNILVGGQYTPYVSRNRKAAYGAVARVTPAGALDSSFGNAGLAVDTAFTSVRALAIQTVNSTPYILFSSGSQIARLTSSGALDATFAGGTCLASTNVCWYGYAVWAIRFDTAGNILAMGPGSLVSGGPPKIVVARFTPTGSLDTTFGLNSTSGAGQTGFSVFDLFGGQNNPNTAVVFSDGSGDLAIGGFATASSGEYFFVVKVDSTGKLVGAFGNSKGAVALDWGGAHTITTNLSNHGLLIEPSDGKLVVGTQSEFTSGPYAGYNFAVARLWP